MEKSRLLVGDHLLMSRLGYDASLPFTRYHMRLWREPHRDQVVIFRAPLPGANEDFIKRLIGLPGDTRRDSPRGRAPSTARRWPSLITQRAS